VRLTAFSIAALVLLSASVAATGVAAIMRAADRSSTPGATELVVACEPGCTSLHVDGVRMPATHGSFAMKPGAHEIVAAKPGFRTEVKRVSVEQGESRAVAFTLASE
jgi:hypothetical protein